MKLLLIFTILLSASFCSSCSKFENDEKTIEEASNFEPIEKVEAVIEEKKMIPQIYENYLLPLEEHSWEMTEKPEYVVLHFTSDVVACRDNPYVLNNIRKIFEENSLSIHYIIDRDGKIEAWVPETRAAWHAGRGEYNGISKLTNAMNKYSIGIEMLAIGSRNDMKQYLTDAEYSAIDVSLIGFTDEQYESLAILVKDICERNDIEFDKEHIIGHEEYNQSKQDPGDFFDWDRLFTR